MDGSPSGPLKELPLGLDATTEEEYYSQSKILQEFTNISTIDKAWMIKSENGNASQAILSLSQPNVLTNKRRQYIQSAHVLHGSDNSVIFEWSPFPIEMTGVSVIVPSPSGSKLFVVRQPDNDSPNQFEIWGQFQLEKDFQVPQSIHGSVYTDGWFEGISWNPDETHIAYVAEEPPPSKPTFNSLGYEKGGSTEKDCGCWKGQGVWEEDWGETYEGKRQPALYVLNINSGEVRTVDGIKKSLSVGQVVWAPPTKGLHRYLVFVGWLADTRKLGIKYCYNRPCALYAIRVPSEESVVDEHQLKDSVIEESPMLKLTQSTSSAFFPRFSPDGRFLVFLSAATSVESGAHSATNSLHRIDWPTDGKPSSSAEIVDAVPVVMCAEDGYFPGLYCSSFLSSPWLSDGCTMVIHSIWGSIYVILSVNALSGNISRISPTESNYSWNILTLDGDNIVAVSSGPVSVPEIKYGYFDKEATMSAAWNWLGVSSPIRCSEKVTSLLSSLQFNVMKIPIRNVSDNLTKGAKRPIEAIFMSSHSKDGVCDPLIVMIHGGPHTTSVSSFSKSLAFLSSIGYNLLIVNYRGSLGFGEEALQSLPGKIGSQDVEDVLTAIDHVIDMGLADKSKISVLGGSHGGFLTTHLIGQAPDLFAAAATRNPACNISSMVGVTDIPDWCYFEAYGTHGKNKYTAAPSPQHLSLFHSISPIAHLSKVKTPTLFLLGAKDLRVPVSNGLQYARALQEKGVEVKVIVFPQDVHGIERPQSDFESFLNIGVWFNKYCK